MALNGQTQSSEQTLIPSLSWYQDTENIYFKIEVQNIKNEVINIESNKFSFKSGSPQYLIDFDLFQEINTDESSYVISEKFIKVSLKKKESEKWPSLTKIKNLYKNNIKIDWNSWYDSDAEEEDDLPKSRNDFSNVDFSSMMQQMQGMGGGPGMGGAPDEQSAESGFDMGSMMKQMEGMSEEELAQFQNSMSGECHDDECEGCDTCEQPELENDEDYSDMPELEEIGSDDYLESDKNESE
jgi:hypothetical protein